MLASLDVVVINQPAARDGNNQELFASLDHHWQQCEKKRIEQSSQEQGTHG